MGSRERRQAPCGARALRVPSCLQPRCPQGSAPEPLHDELRAPAPLRARCPGTRDRATSPEPPGDPQDGRGSPGQPQRERLAEGQRAERSDRAPWYIAAINEKEECLTTLVEEISRLSRYKEECERKDVVIADLLKEVAGLRQQLELLSSAGKEAHTETEHGSPRGEATEVLSEASAPGAVPRQLEAEELALMAQLAAFQKAHEELCAELQRVGDNYNMATGAMCSLQRQLEIQESQLQRTKAEKERLQEELRGRENQLQAMSAKFCSLREEQKHEEMLATVEKENCNLRQLVTEQQSKLAEQNELIGALQGTVSQLQAEALTKQCHIHKQQRAQEELQSQAEMLQDTELQTRVALERVTSRFERFRSKIIQATFSAAGMKPPQAELTDEEVLEAMQKIIDERIHFHQILKQKGIKVPSLTNLDVLTSSPATSKGRRKSPAR